MDKVNIGLIGGCINKQIGIERKDLYYSTLLKLLNDGNKVIHYSISLEDYLSYDKLFEQTKDFIKNKHPDLIFLFIRPFPLMLLQKPIIKHETIKGKVARSMHPALFNRKMIWNETLSIHRSADIILPSHKRTFALRDINILAGIGLGLHQWALKYLICQLDKIKKYCEENHVRLIIISPPKSPESVMANLTCKWLTGNLNKYCKTSKLKFININQFTIEYFEKDKIHFNIQGHKKLGEVLFKALHTGDFMKFEPSQDESYI